MTPAADRATVVSPDQGTEPQRMKRCQPRVGVSCFLDSSRVYDTGAIFGYAGCMTPIEVEQLRQWKSEATEVLDGWHRVFEALGEPGRLGELHYEAAVVEVERLRRIASERVLPDLPEGYGRDLGWWSISGEDFMDAMRRAYLGEEPGALYVEYYVNSDTESVEGRDE